MTAVLAGQLRDYLQSCLGETIAITDLRRLAGGASHETWAFDLIHDRGAREITPLVLRRDFAAGLLAPSLAQEYALLEHLHALKLPVPRPRWCVTEPSPRVTPFMILERVTGVDIRKVLADPAQAMDRQTLGRALVRTQTMLHRVNIAPTLVHILRAADPPGAVREVARWAAVIDRDHGAEPLLTAALGWLRTHLPTQSQLTLVHGDYKTNNLIFSDEGVVVLDWEMAPLGEPLEDLAWTRLWTTEYDLVGGLLSADDYLAAYTAETGLEVEPTRLFFWQLFSLVKLAAIFVSSARLGTHTGHPRPLLAMLGRALPWLESAIAERLTASMQQAI